MTPAKKVFIRTFGCQMNEYDSEKMADVLAAAEGFEQTADPAEADLILFNTCSVRERAEEKLFTRLGEIRQMAMERGERPVVAVTGCVAQQEGEQILKPYLTTPITYRLYNVETTLCEHFVQALTA